LTKTLALLVLLSFQGHISASYDPNNKYHYCFDKVYNGMRAENLESLRECIRLFAEDEELKGYEFFVFSKERYESHRTVSAMRLFYLDLLRGDQEAAERWLDYAIKIERSDPSYLLLDLSLRERKISALAKWLDSESSYKSNIDYVLVAQFYQTRLTI